MACGGRAFLLGLVAVISGCVGVGEHLDMVARSLDDWGTITVSGATLIEPDPKFQLDLELSGNEILRWNRTEGFSNISQYDTLDAQISIRAEIVANVLDQMSATSDPKLLEQLRSQLLGAAFTTLVDQLPSDQRDQLVPFLNPVSGALGSLGTQGAPDPQGSLSSPKAALSDAGAGAITIAEGKLDKARDANARAREAGAAYKRLGEEVKGVEEKLKTVTDETEKKELEGKAEKLKSDQKAAQTVAQDHIRAAWQHLADAMDSLQAATDAAESVVRDAEARFAQLPADVKAAMSSQVDEFKSLASALNDLRASCRSRRTTFADRARNVTVNLDDDNGIDAESNAAESAISTDDPSVVKLVGDARSLSSRARGVAAVQGVSTAGQSPPPAPQKILEAEQIDPARRLALQRLPKFREPLANPSIEASLNLRQLLLLSASDKITLEMLRWLSYPRDNAANKRVYLCMASVNVVPGRLTHRGYHGQVDLMMEYARINAEGVLQRLRGASPTTFAVFPFIDSQVLDLRTSRRRALTVAMQLAVTGYPAAANALLDFARQREHDVATLTGMNTVTSYSSGNHVGFTFSPRLVAQADPSDSDTTPQMSLQPQTFPVIVMIVCDEEYTAPTSVVPFAKVAEVGVGIQELRPSTRPVTHDEDHPFTVTRSLPTDVGLSEALEALRIARIMKWHSESARRAYDRFKIERDDLHKTAALRESSLRYDASASMAVEVMEALDRAARKAITALTMLRQLYQSHPNEHWSVTDRDFDQNVLEAVLNEFFERLPRLRARFEAWRWIDFDRSINAEELQRLTQGLEADMFSDALGKELRDEIARIVDVGRRMGVTFATSGVQGVGGEATHLIWFQSSRWMRAPDPDAQRWPLAALVGGIFTARSSEVELLDRARNLDAARTILRRLRGDAPVQAGDPPSYKATVAQLNAKWTNATEATYVEQHLQTRLNYLATLGLGARTVFALPRFQQSTVNEEVETVLSIDPTVGWADQPNTFFLYSRSAPIFAGGFSVSVGGRAVNATRISPQIARVVMPAWHGSPLSESNTEDEFVPVVVTDGMRVIKAEPGVRFLYRSQVGRPRTRKPGGIEAGFPGGDANHFTRYFECGRKACASSARTGYAC